MQWGVPKANSRSALPSPPSYISEVEGGVRDANERALRLIIAEFNVSEDWLRHGHGGMFNEDRSATLAEAMTLFKKLDEPFQKGALKILKELSEMNAAEKQRKHGD
jgi:hypothetical protein